MEAVSFVLIGAAAGWIAGHTMRGHGFGVVGDTVVGIVGAFAGGYGFRAVGVELGGGILGSLLVAIAGALVLLFLVRFFTRRRSGRKVWS